MSSMSGCLNARYKCKHDDTFRTLKCGEVCHHLFCSAAAIDNVSGDPLSFGAKGMEGGRLGDIGRGLTGTTLLTVTCDCDSCLSNSNVSIVIRCKRVRDASCSSFSLRQRVLEDQETRTG